VTLFELENRCLLKVEVNNDKVFSLAGAMVAYDGQIKFTKSILGGEGLFGALKRRLANEGMSLMVSEGSGAVYFAHKAREVSIIPLNNEKIFIESNSLLAFDHELKTSVAFAGLQGAASGQGLFTTTVEGKGNVAVISDGNLLKFSVEPNSPLFVDPDAFIAYTGELNREFVIDVNWKTMIGETSGESYQIKFSGSGVVYIQPSERR
jgi:uncharacterized protein (AIM24 family)